MSRGSDQAQGVALQLPFLRRLGIIYQRSQTLCLELGGIKFELSRWRFKSLPEAAGFSRYVQTGGLSCEDALRVESFEVRVRAAEQGASVFPGVEVEPGVVVAELLREGLYDLQVAA